MEVGISRGIYTHMIVVMESDLDATPIFVRADEDVRVRVVQVRAEQGRKIEHVFNFRVDREEQLAQERAFYY